MKKKSDTKTSNCPDQSRLLEILQTKSQALRLDAILKIGNFSRSCKHQILEYLNLLAEEGRLVHLAGGGWITPDKIKTLTGTFQSTAQGAGIVKPDDPDAAEFPVHSLHAHGAWNGDKVRALAPGKINKNGRILEILERSQKEVMARVEKVLKDNLVCLPSDRKLDVSFSVSCEKAKDFCRSLKPDDMVVLKPLKKTEANVWKAEIIKVLGAANNIGVQEAIVKSSHQVPSEFPEYALEQARKFADDKIDVAGREDLRNVPFVTIDGKDAKDFDDAVYVEKQGDEWLLMVAIADVSHYVKTDQRSDSLDSEALRRGNSWYFPTSVEPMLPKELSNGLCSLRPNEDRYALVAEMRLSGSGKPLSSRFFTAVINSHGRLVYDDVAAFFEGKEPSQFSKPVSKMLRDAHELYKILKKEREERGTLDFDLPEPAYTFNENGELAEMKVAERNDAHRMIEEFMICANEAVSRQLEAAKIPLLFRVHPVPEQAKIEELSSTLNNAGLESARIIKKDVPVTPANLQMILKKAAGTPQEYLVNKLCLRSMQQARYQPDNVGHFGLASDSYCHFTSPIRRYADLLVHRALKTYLGSKEHSVPDREKLTEIGNQLNNLERSAVECERDIARRLGCFALKKHEGETMQGTISGVTDFGAFVEFRDIPADGLIRMSDLGNDWFEFDAKNQVLRGNRTGQTWKLGQPVNVKVASVNTDRQEIRLIPELPPSDKKHGTRKGFSSKRDHKTAKKRVNPKATSDSGFPKKKSKGSSSKFKKQNRKNK